MVLPPLSHEGEVVPTIRELVVTAVVVVLPLVLWGAVELDVPQNLTLLWVIRVVPHKVLQVDAAEGKGGRGTQAKTISLSVKALEKVGEKGLLGRNKAIKGI